MPDEPSQSFYSIIKNIFIRKDDVNETTKNIEPEDERIEELIENVLNIRDSIVKEIMIPKINISSIRESDTLREIYSTVNETKHSRYPVFDNEKTKALGILHVKDLIGSTEDVSFKLSRILREVKYIPESQSVTSLLEDFKKDKIGRASCRERV